MNKDKNIKIQKTANTLYDLRDHTEVKYSKEISDFLIEKTGGKEMDRISTADFQALPVARYLTNHRVLELFAKKFGKDLQIIELGSGFTPHFLNLNYDIDKYIEVELDINSELKKEITSKLTNKNNIHFVSGDILSDETWNEINQIVDKNKPVLIFSEGVVAQYFNSEQKEQIGNFVKTVMKKEGSAFIIDDTLRNHPELLSETVIKEGMNQISNYSGSKTYKKETSGLDDEFARWKNIFDEDILKIKYVLTKPSMDFVLEKFRLLVAITGSPKEIKKDLENLSDINNNDRIWI